MFKKCDKNKNDPNNRDKRYLKTSNARVDDIREAIMEVYEDYPELQKTLLDWLDNLPTK